MKVKIHQVLPKKSSSLTTMKAQRPNEDSRAKLAKSIKRPEVDVRAQAEQMFEEGLLSDVTFNISSGEDSICLKLHRSVLVHACEFLRRMLLRDSGDGAVNMEVEEGSSVAATVLVLKYLYINSIDIDGENVLAVLLAAKKFQLPSLCGSCEGYLEQSLCQGNMFSIWNISHGLGLFGLAQTCKSYVLLQGNDMFVGNEFTELPKVLAMAVIADRELNASGEVVFEAVVAWGERNKADGTVADAVSDFVPCLRFEKMKYSFLHNRVRQSRLVSESTLLDAVLIGHLSNPTTSPKRHRVFTDKVGADPNLAKKNRTESVPIE